MSHQMQHGTRSEHLPPPPPDLDRMSTPSPPGPGHNVYPPWTKSECLPPLFPPGTRSECLLPPPPPWTWTECLPPLPLWDQVRMSTPPGTRSECLPPPPRDQVTMSTPPGPSQNVYPPSGPSQNVYPPPLDQVRMSTPSPPLDQVRMSTPPLWTKSECLPPLPLDYTQAGGTHPTGMHSCLFVVYLLHEKPTLVKMTVNMKWVKMTHSSP